MTGSTPSDLATAFRSVPRRLREALDGCEDAPVWSGHQRVTAATAEAASILGVGSDPLAVADGIADRHVDDWSEQDLARLQVIALQLGALVREAEAWRDESPAD